MSTASTPLVLAAEAAGESDIPFCLIGVQGLRFRMPSRRPRLTELFVDGAVRGLLVDQRGVGGA